MGPDPVTAAFVRFRDRGDVDALGEVFDALSTSLLALALHACGNAADAEDALQATFVVALRKARSFDAGARNGIGGWLAGVLAGEAKNAARRAARRRDGAPLVEHAAADGDPFAASERRELVALLRTRIEALPDEQRQVLLLQLEHGLQPAQIAEVLRVPPGTVRMRVHRGLAALRAVLPAGLAVLLAASLPARGIAAVRAAVLDEAHALAGAAVASAGAGAVAVAARAGGAWLGGLVVKKLVAAFVFAGVVLGAWWAWPTRGAGDIAPAAPPSTATTAVIAGDAAAGDAADRAPAERVAMPVAGAPAALGSLRVRVLGDVWQREGRGMWSAMSFAGSGTPLAGVVVRVWSGAVRADAPHATLRTGRTDADGVLAVHELSPGTWHVDVADGTRSGTATSATAVVADGCTDCELHAGLRAVVRGRVVDARGVPVADAELWSGGRVAERSDGERELRCAGRTDARGTFACAVLPSEELLGARKDGHAASWSHLLQQLGNGDGEVVLELGDDPATVIARVATPGGGAPPRANVVVEFRELTVRRAADGALRAPPLGWRAREEQPARFVVRGVPPGLVVARAVAEGTVASTVARVVPGGVHEVATFEVPLLAAVAGRVRGEDGEPRAGLTVRVSGPGVREANGRRTDDDGAFRIGGLDSGDATLTVARGANALLEQRVTLRAGEDTVVDLAVTEPPPLRGRVVDAAGTGMGGLRVDATQGETTRGASTDGDGRFVIRGVEPGAVTFAVARDRTPHGGSSLLERAFDALDLADPVELVLPAAATATGVVTGRVVDERGLPIAGAHVDMNVEHMPPTFFPNVDAAGAFRLDGVPPGRVSLDVDAEGFLPRAVVVDVVADAVRDAGAIVLGREARLRVRWLRPDGRPWREQPPVPVLLAGDVPLLAGNDRSGNHGLDHDVVDGAVVVSRIPPGRYRVGLPDDDELLVDAQEVEIRGGDVADLVMPTSVGRRCTFEFCDTTGWTPGAKIDVAGVSPDGGERFRRSISAPAATAPGGAPAVPSITVVLPFGPLDVTATRAGQVTHRCRVAVRPSFTDRSTFTVPAIRD
jgi:RNA polymerase sigma factor (sigma-70 family)